MEERFVTGRLSINKEEDHKLKELAKVYRNVFNEGINLQFEYMTLGRAYEEQLLSEKSFYKKLEEIVEKDIPYSLKVDKGIILHAATSSFESFREWWNQRMIFPSIEGTPRFPKLINPERDGIFFETETPTRVSKGQCIYVSKTGRLKTQGKILLGLYSGARYFLKGDKWYVTLLDRSRVLCFDYDAKLTGILTLTIFDDGSMKCNDVYFENIVNTDNYKNQEDIRRKLNEKLAKQTEANTNKDGKIVVSKNMGKVKKEIQKVSEKMWNIQKNHFNIIKSNISLECPKKILIKYESCNGFDKTHGFSERRFKNSGISFFLESLISKLKIMKTQIEFDKNIDTSCLKF